MTALPVRLRSQQKRDHVAPFLLLEASSSSVFKQPAKSTKTAVYHRFPEMELDHKALTETARKPD
jgi:hypothetical protein